MEHNKALFEAVIAGNAGEAERITREGVDVGADPEQLINVGMIPAMDEVGRRFEAGEFFIPELLIAARAMKAALALMRPLLAERGAKPAGRVVIGTIVGDQHDIGKNLVASMLEGGGFEVTDLGYDVSPERFAAAVRTGEAQIVGISALLTTTMPNMKCVVDELRRNDPRSQTKIMIGGAPVTEAFAAEIGADGYAPNASAAVKVARKFVSELSRRSGETS